MTDVALPVVDELARRLDGEVRFARHDRMLYATDASIYQVEPLGVVIPRTPEDVEETVRWCAERGLALLPRGGGTSLAGQTVNRAVVLDCSPHLDALIEVDVEGRTARVQPGLVLDHLNAALTPHGLMFGPDVATATHATLGGMIGNNSAGAHSVLYGRTVEHVVAIDVLLADGTRVRLDEGAAARDRNADALTRRVADVVLPLAEEIDRRFPRIRRHVDGYNLDLVLAQLRGSEPGRFDRVNLAHLLCGAEGTLGITLEATLRLVEAPLHKGLAIVAFADLDAALAAVGPILAARPAAVELLDEVIIDLAEENLEYRRYVDLLPRPGGARPAAVLYVEHFGGTPGEIAARFDDLAARFGADAVARYQDPDAMIGAWKLRKAGEPLLHGRPGPRKPVTFIEDTAVDPARLPEFVRRFRAIVARHGTTASYYAHASVGCLHIRPMIDLGDERDRAAMAAITEAVTDLVIEFGGALSGEHGDGRLRSHMLERFYGRAICDGFRAIKSIFDPEGRLNPGIITDPAPMVEQLRVKPGPRFLEVPDVPTFFRYEREHGFSGAVEMCNGAGVCRKTVGGTMCPSYRATRDERHSTRGRGNALRLAITGQIGSAPGAGAGTPAWNDPATLETLDLCLSCKACKSECPSNVDVARLKAEYLAQGYAARGGAPLPARMFGNVRALNRLASRAPRLANAVTRFPPVRAVIDRVLGLDPRRTLPPAAPSLARWFGRRSPAALPADAPAVVLYPDCFTTYGEPALGRAAVHVLESLGYRVVLPRAVGCCGRARISNGLLEAAVETCRASARALGAAVREHGAAAVVSCEPSCHSALVDDWLDLEMDVDRDELRRIAAIAMTIEDFIERAWERHPRRPDLAPTVMTARPGPVLVHGHCHQKSLWGTDATMSLLRRVAGDGDGSPPIDLIDSGCCGMAGAFGFTRAHYDLSMEIGDLSLFPAVQGSPEATIIAPGTSCRHQLRDGLGREAVHPVVWVAARLGFED